MTSTPTAPSPSTFALLAALPRIRELVDQLRQAMHPAVLAEPRAHEVDAIDRAVTAIARAVDAVDAVDAADHLTEVADLGTYVTHAAHRRLAELRDLDQLTSREDERRIAALGVEVVIERVHLSVALPNETTASIALRISPLSLIELQCSTVDLAPINELRQLWIAAALEQLGQAITTALPDTAFAQHS